MITDTADTCIEVELRRTRTAIGTANGHGDHGDHVVWRLGAVLQREKLGRLAEEEVETFEKCDVCGCYSGEGPTSKRAVEGIFGQPSSILFHESFRPDFEFPNRSIITANIDNSLMSFTEKSEDGYMQRKKRHERTFTAFSISDG